jgi:hypothetical protein
VSIPPGFCELTEASVFAAAKWRWFEKIENGRAIMLAAFPDSAMGTAVLHLAAPRHEVTAGLGAFALPSSRRPLETRS